MNLLKTLVVIVLVATNIAPAFAVTEITSAPESFLSASTLDVTEGCTLINRRLALGDNNEEVLALGNFLKAKKYFSGKPTKKFTAALEKALIKYQVDNKLFANESSENLGVVTAATKDKIASDSCKKRDIETPSTSCVFLTRNLMRQNNDERFVNDNRMLQRFLVQKGYMSSTFVTGEFGSITREAVIRFQLDNGIISSATQEGAGEVGPRTREFIVANTCGKSDVEATTDAKKIGYTVSLSTKTGVKIDSSDNEQVLSIKIKPQEQNARLNNLTLQLETATSTKPSDFIESVEIYTKNKLISRTRGDNIWTAVSGSANNFTVRLNGSTEMLSRGEEFDVTVKVTPKSSALSVTPKEFKMFVPSKGLVVEFSNSSGVVKGNETWGSVNQKSSFTIGKPAATTNTGTTTNTSTSTTPTSNSTSTATTKPQSTVVEAPQLNRIVPAQGSFGDTMVLKGKNFAPRDNKVVLVHGPTGASTTMSGYVSKDGEITFQFPQKGRDFVKANGKKTSGEVGNYRLSVISNGKQSNSEVFRILK